MTTSHSIAAAVSIFLYACGTGGVSDESLGEVQKADRATAEQGDRAEYSSWSDEEGAVQDSVHLQGEKSVSTSEVTFTNNLSLARRTIVAGDPGAGGASLPPTDPNYPRIVVAAAMFVINGNLRDLKAWFAVTPLVMESPTRATSVLSFVGTASQLNTLAGLRAVGDLEFQWQPADAGSTFHITTRFVP
jgi:hypothetical protein